MKHTRVVIVGGGFGGFSVARRLMRSANADQFAITIVDPSSVSVYTPWLYEVASGGLLDVSLRGDLVHATDISLDQWKGIRFHKTAMTGMDVASRHIACADGTAVPYDICVLAMGSVSNDFGIAGVKQFAADLKRTSDALMIRTELSSIIHSASQSAKRIVVVGGGPNGVEFSAECAATIRALERSGKIAHRSIEIMLIDSGADPLMVLSPRLREVARNRLRDLGIVIRSNTALAHVSDGAVGLRAIHNGIPTESIEIISSEYCVTAIGVKMPAIVGTLPFTKHEKGRILVDASLRAIDHPEIFVLGDIAAVDGAEKLDPQTAQVAVRQSITVAKNICATINRAPMKTYRSKRSWDVVVALGGKYAIGTALGIPLVGYTAYILRRCVDARYFFSVLPFRDALRRVIKGVTLYGKNENTETY